MCKHLVRTGGARYAAPMLPDHITSAVEAGAAYLDTHLAWSSDRGVKWQNWWELVNTDTLQTRYANCVIGQLFQGNYPRALVRLRLPAQQGNSVDGDARGKIVDLGFYAHTEKDWELLDQAWIELINNRRNAA